MKSPSLPWLPTREETERRADNFERRWGDPALAYEVIGMSNPSASEEEPKALPVSFGSVSAPVQPPPTFG